MTAVVFLWWMLSFAVAAAIGYCIVSLFWPEALPPAYIWIFAPGIGLGICSLIVVLFRRPMFTVELGVLAVLLYMTRRAGNLRLSRMIPWGDIRIPAAIVLLLCAGGVALSAMIQIIDRTPHGDWDAWNIWIAHAKYLYRAGPSWKAGLLNTFHPDYPLLTSALYARLWRYAGAETAGAGGLIGIYYSLGTVAVLAGVLALLRDRTIAVLISLVLLSTPFFVEYGVSQSADVPLGFYFLCAAALVCLQSARFPDHQGLLVLAGIMAGFAGWTKNEGQLFIPVILVAVVMAGPWKLQPALRRVAAVAAGVAVPLAVILYFKAIIEHPNDIFSNRYSVEVIPKILDWSRYTFIASTYWSTFWAFGKWSVHPALPVLAFVLLRGVDWKMLRNSGWLATLLITLAMPMGYFSIYVITPMDLTWHVNTSLERLFLQIWPLLLLVVGLSAARRDPINSL